MHTDRNATPYPQINGRAFAAAVGLLDRERLMSIGVNRPDGWPHVSTVGYANEGLDLYFMTERESRKLANLAADSRISLSIHADGTSDGLVCLVMSGHAHEVSSPDEIQALSARLSERWPDFSVYCPTSRALAVVRFRPEVICMISAVDGQSSNAYFSLRDAADDPLLDRHMFQGHPALREKVLMTQPSGPT